MWGDTSEGRFHGFMRKADVRSRNLPDCPNGEALGKAVFQGSVRARPGQASLLGRGCESDAVRAGSGSIFGGVYEVRTKACAVPP